MKNFLLGIFLTLALGSTLVLNAQQQERIELKNHGLILGSGTNASPVIKKILDQYRGQQNLCFVLPGGRIDLWPEGSSSKELYVSNATEDDTLSKVKSIAFLFENMQNVRVEGNNTLIVLHGKMVSFAIVNSRDIHLKDLAFDMDRPTMSEMTIRSSGPDSIIASIHPDSKYEINKGKISFFGEGWKVNQYHTIAFVPATAEMTYSSFKPFEQSQAMEKSTGTILFKGRFDTTKYRAGTVLSFRDPYRDNCGAFVSMSSNIRLEGLNMHYMHGLGIVAQFSENLNYKNIRVAPRANSGRIISSFADCFHFSGCKGKIIIDSCFTSGSHDDPINVHGTHLKISNIDNTGKITVRFMHHQTYGFPAFFAGDSIAFVDPQTLRYMAYATLKTASLENLREMDLTLEGSLKQDIPPGTVIENLSWTPELTIRNSRFERTNTRGILVTTRKKVLIENNQFDKIGMHAILIANDASSWYESGPVTDLTIRNNVFKGCGYNSAPGGYAISIAPENHRLSEGFYVHRNISVENNLFQLAGQPALGARSVAGLIFRNNRIEGKYNSPALVKLDACDQVLIEKNHIANGVVSSVKLMNMVTSQLKTDLKKVEN